MTAETFWSIGTRWLGSASRPRVAKTDVSPRSSGIDAPIREPNTSSRIPSVSGMETIPARASCDSNIVSSAFPVEAEPASPT